MEPILFMLFIIYFVITIIEINQNERRFEEIKKVLYLRTLCENREKINEIIDYFSKDIDKHIPHID